MGGEVQEGFKKNRGRRNNDQNIVYRKLFSTKKKEENGIRRTVFGCTSL